MDIRCYESVIRKVKESKKYLDTVRDNSVKSANSPSNSRSFKHSLRNTSDNAMHKSQNSMKVSEYDNFDSDISDL